MHMLGSMHDDKGLKEIKKDLETRKKLNKKSLGRNTKSFNKNSTLLLKHSFSQKASNGDGNF